MKILVDELPETPRDCPFSTYDREHHIYVCTLRPYIEEAGCKPKCICKRVDLCDRLIPINEIKGD